jgi:two-component sensor histidine kinase
MTYDTREAIQMAVDLTPPASPAPIAGTVQPSLEHFGGRPETMARVHRLLAARSGASVDISEFVREIANGVIASQASAGKVRLNFAGDKNCNLSQERALALGLIVGELVANSIAYAHPAGVAGRLDIACQGTADGTIMLTLSDDGVGLPEGLDPMNDGQSGLPLVRMLAAKLDATIAFHSDALGLSFHLRMRAA